MYKVVALWVLLMICYFAGLLQGYRQQPRQQPRYDGSQLAHAARLVAADRRRQQLEMPTVELRLYIARARVAVEHTQDAT